MDTKTVIDFLFFTHCCIGFGVKMIVLANYTTSIPQWRGGNMSEEFIGSGENGTGSNLVADTVMIGNKHVSAQFVQQMYKEITGKSEKISKSYNDNILLKYDDIEGLFFKIQQSLEQFNVREQNNCITLYYSDDTHDDFSSFERFRLQAKSSSSAVESIYIKFNFMIVLPKIQKVQTYAVSVRFVSRIAVEKRMSNDFFFMPPKTIAFMGRRTGLVEIEYVDYSVARNFLHIFDEWHKSVKKNNVGIFTKFSQRNSHWIPRIIPFFTVLIVSYFLISAMTSFVSSEEPDVLSFGVFSGYALCAIYIARTLSFWLARSAENALDGYNPISYIKLTRGDEICIEEFNKANRGNIIRSLIGFFGAISVSLFAKIIVTMIESYIDK